MEDELESFWRCVEYERVEYYESMSKLGLTLLSFYIWFHDDRRETKT